MPVTIKQDIDGFLVSVELRERFVARLSAIYVNSRPYLIKMQHEWT